MGNLLGSLVQPSSLLIPIIAILISHRSIAGERELGSIRFLLALPHTRGDVLLGKLVGRTAVVAVSILVGFGAGAVVAFIYYDLILWMYIAFIGLTVLLGAVYVSIGVAISAMTGSVAKAAGMVLGVFVLLEFVWEFFWYFVLYLASGFSIPLNNIPAWYDFILAMSPGTLYEQLMVTLANKDPNREFVIDPPVDLAALSLPEWFPVIALIGWLVLPFVVGYWRFNRADL